MLQDPALPLAAGYLLWAALSALAIAAGWTLSAAYMPGAGLLARWQAALLVAGSLVLTSVQGLGAVGALARAPLAVVGLALAAAGIALALLGSRRAGGASLS